MIEGDLATEIIVDLIRSSWIIERSRAALYQVWAEASPQAEDSAARTLKRAAIVERTLETFDRSPDEDLVEDHTAWLRSLVGDDPREIPLGNLFIARIGDWVEGHAGPFLAGGRDEMTALGEQEKAALSWPEQMPAPPGFEPLDSPEATPPGPVRFRFGILADLHIGSAHGERMARAAIADLNASGAELVIQLGDITDHGNKDEFDLATEVLGELQMPFATMMGNHDVYSIGEERLSGREYYSSAFGRAPDGVLLEHKGVRFAVLDSVEHGASPISAFDFVSGTFIEGPGGAIVRGSLSTPQHDILADVASPGAGPAFIFLHHPTQPFTGFPPVLFGLRDPDAGRIHATVDSGNVWGVFAGHTHRNARTRTYDSVVVQEVGIPRDYPFGYALVDVSDNGYAYNFKQLSDEDLLRAAYQHAGRIHRCYGGGKPEERSFSWTAP